MNDMTFGGQKLWHLKSVKTDLSNCTLTKQNFKGEEANCILRMSVPTIFFGGRRGTNLYG